MAGERELWFFWNKHIKEVDDHQAVIQTCLAYASKFPQDPFLPLVQSIEAWHLLSRGKTDEAWKKFNSQLAGGESGLESAVQRVARGWITRLQQGQLRDALQIYYKKEVRYPERLDKLASHPGISASDQLPLKDAWNVSWNYKLVGFKGVAGFRDQKYELKSNSLLDGLGVQEALAVPYASGIHAEPSRVARGGAPGIPVVQLNFTRGAKSGQRILGQVGREVEGLTVAYAGKDLVVLCDALHWSVLTWKK